MAKKRALEFEPGQTLSNGAIVIEYDDDHQKVLAVWEGNRDPFVIWAIDQVTGEPYRGNYFTHLDSAIEIWFNRHGRR